MSGGTGNNHTVRVAQGKIIKWAEEKYTIARRRGDTIFAYGDLNSISESKDAVGTKSVVRSDSVVSKLQGFGLFDTWRHINNDVVAYTHPANLIGIGNRLDYVLMSPDGCMSMVRAGIHIVPFQQGIWPFDHFVMMVDIPKQ